ncbi:hypothetical protein RDI58_000772 [Solanum bulbocastanum]|uniref:Uncharacterized protein n=1 Tax=Solanum bulbocastanum TaxID=147425 RepID=A0AAN8U6T1_SOLBU
MLTKNYSPR